MQTDEEEIVTIKNDTIHYRSFLLEKLLPIYHSEGNSSIREMLSNKIFTFKDLSKSMTYRTINHWSEIGLIDSQEEGKWRKFSYVDVIWILAISEMREFGLSIQKIANAKNCLFINSKTGQKSFIFDAFILYVLLGNSGGLIMFDDGYCVPLADFEQSFFKNSLNISSHLYINLNKKVASVFKKLYPGFKPRFFNELTREEVSFFAVVKSGKYQEITIKFKDGKINLLEKKEHVKNEKRIIEILKDNDFQNIEIKQVSGKVVSITRTIKEKP